MSLAYLHSHESVAESLQSVRLTDENELPLDARLVRGVLPNGLSYYIRNHAIPANRVELRLAVRIGSLVETDDEQGLAHFVEHMGFKGTKSYESWEIVEYLESIGASFGADVNAHTSMEETVYRLHIPINALPTSSSTQEPKVMENVYKGLHILSEWAFHMSMKDKDIESERRIIEEEWRSHHGTSQRMLETYWKRIFEDGNSLQYAHRMPIGNREVFMNCAPHRVRDFYRKWYIPSHMAVIVVGDIGTNPAPILAQITSLFGQTASNSETVIPRYPLPVHNRTVFCAMADRELVSASLSIEFCKQLTVQPTISWLRLEIIKRLFTSLIDSRLVALSRKGNDPPFLNAGISIRPLIPKILCTGITAEIAHDRSKIQLALDTLVEEIERICQHGFHHQELDAAKSKWTSTFQNQLRDLKNYSSSQIISEYLHHFKTKGQSILSGEELELRLSLRLIEDIKLDEVFSFVQRFRMTTPDNTFTDQSSQFNDSFCVISLQEPFADETGFEALKDADLELMLSRSMARCHGALPKWQVRTQKSQLLISKPIPGRIKTSKTFECIGMEEFVLQNGVRIALKHTNFREDTISFQAFALRGSSELTELQEVAMSLLGMVADESGLGELNGIDYAELSSRSKTRVHTQKHYYHRGIGGSCPSSPFSFELMLQMIYLKLTRQSFDEDVFRRVVGKHIRRMERETNSPYFYFSQRSREVMFGQNVPVFRPITNRVLEQVTLKDMEELYYDAFLRNPCEFTFVFVGDFSKLKGGDGSGAIESLISKYLGALRPSINMNTKEDYMSPIGSPYSNRNRFFGGDFTSRCCCLESNGGGCSIPFISLDGTTIGAEDEEEGKSNVARWKRSVRSLSEAYAVSDANCSNVFRCSGLPSPLSISFPQRKVIEGVYECMEDVSTVHLSFYLHLPVEETYSSLLLRMVCDMTKTKLLTLLRREMGDTYTVSVDFSRFSLANFGILTIQFICSPKNMSAAIDATLDALETLKSSGFTEKEVDTCREILLRKHEMSVKSNSYWLFWMLDSYKEQSIRMEMGSALEVRAIERNEWVHKSIEKKSTKFADILHHVKPDMLSAKSREVFNLDRYCIVHLSKKDTEHHHLRTENEAKL